SQYLCGREQCKYWHRSTRCFFADPDDGRCFTSAHFHLEGRKRRPKATHPGEQCCCACGCRDKGAANTHRACAGPCHESGWWFGGGIEAEAAAGSAYTTTRKRSSS